MEDEPFRASRLNSRLRLAIDLSNAYILLTDDDLDYVYDRSPTLDTDAVRIG